MRTEEEVEEEEEEEEEEGWHTYTLHQLHVTVASPNLSPDSHSVDSWVELLSPCSQPHMGHFLPLLPHTQQVAGVVDTMKLGSTVTSDGTRVYKLFLNWTRVQGYVLQCT